MRLRKPDLDDKHRPKMNSRASSLKWNELDGRTGVFYLEADEIVIGRREDAAIVFKHAEVSRRHASVRREEQGLTLVDLESTFGTYINGARISRHLLQPGDRIRLGQNGPEMEVDSGDPHPATVLDLAIAQLTSVLPAAGSADSAISKISYLLDLQYAFGQNFSADSVFRQIIKSVLDLSGAQRGCILRLRKGKLSYAAGLDARGTSLNESDFSASQSVIARVKESGQAIFMTKGINADLALQQSIVAQSLLAVACLPLQAIGEDSGEAEAVGLLYIDSRQYMHAMTGLDQKILTRLADEAGRAIEKLEMVAGAEERRKLNNDLALANEAQTHLLPRQLPAFPPFEIHAFSRPTRHVGGDFYDFFPSGESLNGVLADIAGKGIASALMASMVQGAMAAEFRTAVSPDVPLNALNNLVWRKTPASRYATLFAFMLGEDGAGRYVGAGHNPSYLYRAATGVIEELPSSGMPMGLFPTARYESTAFQMAVGDALIIYSDGLTEAESVSGDMFGEDRVKAIIARDAAGGSAALGSAILGEVEAFTRDALPTDDLTFLIVQRT
ncbi:MAG TPA: SpoIIE family protein phosphatase [Bryobacteraceae bacterium]|nr:SpoIIE family protein phosphatase [Bryobacteraceae bacterium]